MAKLTVTPSPQKGAEIFSKGRSYIFGTPIAWIAIYAALIAVTSFVPILPYAGGGGYWTLAYVLTAVAPLVLGVVPGAVAGIVGTLIGMFITPVVYPLGLMNVFDTGLMPALYFGLAFNMKKYWKYFIPVHLLETAGMFTYLFFYPGVSGGWTGVNTHTFTIYTLWYWLVPLVLLLSPVGTKYIYEWSRSSNLKFRTAGIFIGSLLCWNAFFATSGYWFYWFVFAFPAALLNVMFWGVYSWYNVIFAVIQTIFGAPVLNALSKSGYAKLRDALW